MAKYCITQRFDNCNTDGTPDENGSFSLQMHEVTPEWGSQYADPGVYYIPCQSKEEAAQTLVMYLNEYPGKAFSNDEEEARKVITAKTSR